MESIQQDEDKEDNANVPRGSIQSPEPDVLEMQSKA